MPKKDLIRKLDYDEEPFRDKAKRGAGALALIGSGSLSLLHTLSHIVPAAGVLGLSLGEKNPALYNFVSNEYVQLAYVPFVALSFYYMYRDHQHHKHEMVLRKKISEMEKLLREAERK